MAKMNERIKVLDKVAQEYAGCIAGNDEDSDQVEWFNIYKEKFAELVVKECATVVDDDTVDTGSGVAAGWCEGKDLLKHFGVEE